MVRLQLLRDDILVQEVAGPARHRALLLPDVPSEDGLVGQVVAVGPGRLKPDGTRIPLDIDAGDFVLFHKYAGTAILFEGADYLVLRRDDVFATLSAAPNRDWLLVEVHILDDDVEERLADVEQIQTAVGELLETFGYAPDPETVTLTLASWHWREWFKRQGPKVGAEASEVFDEIKEALRRQQIDIAGATAFEKRANAAATLLNAVQSCEEVAVRLGDVLVVKTKIDGMGRTLIETMSPQLARELETNPILLRDPARLFARLENKRDDSDATVAPADEQRRLMP